MNLDKLDAAIAYIEANPEEHDQTYWFQLREEEGEPCGTAMCLAGVIVWQAGWRPVWGGGDMDLDTEASVVEKNGETERVQRLAKQILSPANAWEDALIEGMFSGGNRLPEIRQYRDDYVRESGEAGERSDLPKGTSDLGGDR